MDWLPEFWDWLRSNLDLLANLGSLAGFASAVIIFFRARALRKHYMLLTRGVELLRDLNRHSSVLNDLLDTFIFLKDANSERQIKDELNQSRSTIRGIKGKVPLRIRRDLYKLQRTIKQAREDVTEDRIFNVYSELRRVADDISNHVEDTKVRA